MLTLFRVDLSENVTLKQYLREYTSEPTLYVDFETLKFNETKLSGISAITATWNMSLTSSQGPFSKSLLIFAIKDNTVYIIQYKTGPEMFNKWIPDVNRIVNSFQIIS